MHLKTNAKYYPKEFGNFDGQFGAAPSASSGFGSDEIRRHYCPLLQNGDAPVQLFIVERVAPLAIFVAIGHAAKVYALNHEKFQNEW